MIRSKTMKNPKVCFELGTMNDTGFITLPPWAKYVVDLGILASTDTPQHERLVVGLSICKSVEGRANAVFTH